MHDGAVQSGQSVWRSVHATHPGLAASSSACLSWTFKDLLLSSLSDCFLFSFYLLTPTGRRESIRSPNFPPSSPVQASAQARLPAQEKTSILTHPYMQRVSGTRISYTCKSAAKRADFQKATG